MTATPEPIEAAVERLAEVVTMLELFGGKYERFWFHGREIRASDLRRLLAELAAARKAEAADALTSERARAELLLGECNAKAQIISELEDQVRATRARAEAAEGDPHTLRAALLAATRQLEVAEEALRDIGWFRAQYANGNTITYPTGGTLASVARAALTRIAAMKEKTDG